jgi:hypothetical protein
MIRSSDDLPEPLYPSTPILAQGMKDSVMFSNTVLSGMWVLVRPFIVKMY